MEGKKDRGCSFWERGEVDRVFVGVLLLRAPERRSAPDKRARFYERRVTDKTQVWPRGAELLTILKLIVALKWVKTIGKKYYFLTTNDYITVKRLFSDHFTTIEAG